MRLRLKIQPRAGRTEVAGTYGDRLKIRVQAPPVDGAANIALTRFLTDAFEVSPGRVQIETGATGTLKTVAIETPEVMPSWLPTQN
ncbi:MAG: DUF167 domain-containing protein [Gammaproteobacteria bacterium]|nr:DUF167 domain-containing protein [Gammaproteobacteria bacterium]